MPPYDPYTIYANEVGSHEEPEDEPYAVMVWFYGGAFQSGANIQYPGTFLAMKDVVVVSVNYRLNNLGFAYTGDDTVAANAGLLDQQLALRWVQNNIAQFGGDPDRVTIFGQSAGGASTGHHVVSPTSAGLFHQAILQSGCEQSMWAFNGPDQEPEKYIEQVAVELDCEIDNTEDMVACLRTKNAGRIARTSINCTEGYFCLGMAPVIDGEFLPESPGYLRAAGLHNKVPEMVGQTREDGMIYALAFLGLNGTNEGFTREEFVEIIDWAVDAFTAAMPDQDRAGIIKAAMDWFYSPWPNIYDGGENRYAISEIVTDVGWGFMNDVQMQSQTQDADVFHYVFGYRSTDAWIPEWLGVFHAMELPYVFGYPFLVLNPDVRNDTGIHFDILDWNAEDIEYADYVITLWTNFAKYGNPTPEPVSPPNRGDPVTWEAYDNEARHLLWIDNEVSETRIDWRQKDYAFWKQHLRCLIFPDFELPDLPGFTGCGQEDSRKHFPTRRSQKSSTSFSQPRAPLRARDLLEAVDQMYKDMVEMKLNEI